MTMNMVGIRWLIVLQAIWKILNLPMLFLWYVVVIASTGKAIGDVVTNTMNMVWRPMIFVVTARKERSEQDGFYISGGCTYLHDDSF